MPRLDKKVTLLKIPRCSRRGFFICVSCQVGAISGACLGSGCGAFAFFLVSLLLPAQAKARASLRVKGVSGAFWGALLGASAGAMTGDGLRDVLFYLFHWVSAQFETAGDFVGRFLYGSVIRILSWRVHRRHVGWAEPQAFAFPHALAVAAREDDRRLPQPVA